ncbi:pentatricopeptide repeat-containing protein At2g17210 [Ricinus communis]|uniref:Pentatricopeptide repeat-containing protein, putative n=1 Tax=Ricinus communis TaxID=3988 RepID=B9S4L3_RICCO|nr:pentatricopeptide repeat-containing protein At2g17210 [Ricinus communis]EEF41477.1 pentatricopeptide repeat-containing protein, putative [Ricinus communis]|eukprot:XP_002520932.1 pentatricopeptide repeat-containing protein At2g17210 [Ricinus communis]
MGRVVMGPPKAQASASMAMRFLSTSRLLSWTLRIKELSSNEKWHEVISQYYEITNAGISHHLLDVTLFPPVLKACSYLSYIDGKCLHACLIKTAFDSFTSIGNSILNFYIKCGELDTAVSVFDSMRSRDSVSWNVLIHGCLDYGALVEGLWQFINARVAGFEPNISTLVLLVQACRSLRAKQEGLQLHGYLIQSGLWASWSVQNSFLCMYADVDMDCARILFDEMPEKDVISWSAMIGGYVQYLEDQIGLQIFQKMLSTSRITPDGVILVSVLKACANSVNITMGRLVHGLTICRGLDSDLFVKNSLIDMYSKCKDAGSAFEVFSEMPRRNNVSWNSLLSGLILNKKYSEALLLVYSMRTEGIEADEVTLVNCLQICKYFAHPYHCKAVHCATIRRGCESNEIVLNSLIDAYAKCNLIELAWEVFSRTRRRDVVLWSTMIAGFAHCGKPDEAIAVFQKMNEGIEVPNAVTIINLLQACSVSAELKRSMWAHGAAIRRGLAAEVAVGTAIVDMYSKCGEIEASRKAFNQIPQKNIITWSTMIAAYGMNGLAHEALALLAQMKSHEIKPNALTYLSVLTACSHGGLVEMGLSVFKSMIQDHGVDPEFEHYSCMVDMLSRAGKLDDAMELIRMMPETFRAGASVWGALLSACRTYRSSTLGEKAVYQVLELEPLNLAGYLLASSMYASDGLWDNAARMKLLARERGVRAVAGYSIVHVDSKAHKFVAGDKSCSQAGNIHHMLNQLHFCMKIDQIENIGFC